MRHPSVVIFLLLTSTLLTSQGSAQIKPRGEIFLGLASSETDEVLIGGNFALVIERYHALVLGMHRRTKSYVTRINNWDHPGTHKHEDYITQIAVPFQYRFQYPFADMWFHVGAGVSTDIFSSGEHEEFSDELLEKGYTDTEMMTKLTLGMSYGLFMVKASYLLPWSNPWDPEFNPSQFKGANLLTLKIGIGYGGR